MTRRLLNLLTALSLLLCVAVCVLWVRSFSVRDIIAWGRGEPSRVNTRRVITSNRGDLRCEAERFSFKGPALPPGARVDHKMHVARGWWRAAPSAATRPADSVLPLGMVGFRFEHESVEWESFYGQVAVKRRFDVSVSYWFLGLVAAALPCSRGLRIMWRKSSRSRIRRGLCPRCGYDLRATRGRCPECGTVAQAQAAGAVA